MRARSPRDDSDTQTESPEFQRFLLESVLNLNGQFNPAYPLSGTRLGAPLSDASNWQGEAQSMQAVATAWAPLVGWLEYETDNGGRIRIGTAFRIPGPRPLALTARHILPLILPPTAGVFDYPFATASAGVSHRPLRLVFDGGPVDAKVLWCHKTFDLLLLELNAAGNLPPVGPGIRAPKHNEKIAVIGFPLDAGNIARAGNGVFGQSSLGRKHLSPGFVSAGGIRTAMNYHMASTLPGFSGAPVIALSDGALLGVHVWGSSGEEENAWLNDLCGLRSVFQNDQEFGAMVQPPNTPPGSHVTGPVPLDLSGGASAESRLRQLDLDMDELRDEPLLASLAQDRPDFRDLAYVPGLRRPRDTVQPRGRSHIRDQSGLSYCAACALAAVIERQLANGARVNVRMLHENARLQDEWAIPGLRGTSLRGVIKGFFHNGVCPEGPEGRIETDPYWMLTRERAKAARKCVPGSYFRVGRSVTDMRMAVQETGGVLMAARIHKGWIKPDTDGRILPDPRVIGQHAFAVTGYTPEGFIVQNSWGKGWSGFEGRDGHALWSYQDWADSMIDAWTLRLAPSSSSAFNLVARDLDDKLPMPRRSQLIGHVVSVEADRVLTSGTLAMGVLPLMETMRFLKSEEFRASYDALLLIHHDPFLGSELVARIAGQMTKRLKQARIYPMHVLYGFDEIATWVLRLRTEAERVAAAYAGSGVDGSDYLERRVAPLVKQALANLEPRLRSSAKDGPLRQVLDLLTGPDLPRTMVLAAGAGCLIARATALPKQQLPPERNFWLMPVVSNPAGYTVLRLGAETRTGAIPGYEGDWPDLVAATTGMAGKPRNLARSKGTASGGNLCEALTGSELTERLRGSVARAL